MMPTMTRPATPATAITSPQGNRGEANCHAHGDQQHADERERGGGRAHEEHHPIGVWFPPLTHRYRVALAIFAPDRSILPYVCPGRNGRTVPPHPNWLYLRRFTALCTEIAVITTITNSQTQPAVPNDGIAHTTAAIS